MRLVGVEPTTGPLSGACLAATGYTSAALPVELQAREGGTQRHMRNGFTGGIVCRGPAAFKSFVWPVLAVTPTAGYARTISTPARNDSCDCREGGLPIGFSQYGCSAVQVI